jgi:Protein kinase domain
MKPLAADDPRMIGEYRLHGRLGAGGMGRVYLGLSPAGRAVAIKVVHPELASDTQFLRRFQAETAAARAVSGLYTAPVVASGLDEHPPWLATAFVPGPSLDQVVSEHGPLPEAALWPLLAGLVEALQAIHACGLVHRDLKPANVLLAADGPRVIDFGISRAADGTTLTASGVVFGTPGYMSPEQAEGAPAGPASDVFALGCLIGYAATGAMPFGAGTAAAVLYRVVHGQPSLDGMPPQLREIVSACLAKDQAARPTPRELADAIANSGRWTGPSAVAFWPRPVAAIIEDNQARLEHDARHDASGLAGATTAYPTATLTRPINGEAGQGQARQGQAGQAASRAAQAPPAPSRPQGYGAPPGYRYPGPRGYREPPGLRARLGAAPPSVLTAVKLMYAGAAFAVLQAVGLVAAITTIVSVRYNEVGYGPVRSALPGAVGLVVLASAAEIALWLWMASACKTGKNWARVTSTVLFGIYTLSLPNGLTHPYLGTSLTRLASMGGWLIAAGAVAFLWQRQSSGYFR